MKKLIRAAALLICALLLCPRVSAEGGAVMLGDRGDLITARESLDGLGLNKAHSGEEITVWELSFDKGLGFHCLPDKDAYLEFDISSLNKKYFSATVGVLQKASYYIELGDIAFSVYGDGELLTKTDVISWNMKPAYICVNVEGVKTLRLVESNGGNYACDAGVWGDAMLTDEKPEAPEWTKPKGGFDRDKTDLPQPAEAVSGDIAYVSDLYFLDSKTYSGNVVGRDCNTANEIIFSTDGKFFSKGVGFHASSGEYTSFCDVNIEGLGFTKFAAYVGVCETLSPHDISMAAVRFALFGDGVKLWESGVQKYGQPMSPMTADITGVKVLRLAVCGAPSISGAWATWGGAVMSKSGQIPDDKIYSEQNIEDIFDTSVPDSQTEPQTSAAEDTEPESEPQTVTDAPETAPVAEERKGSTKLPVIVAVCAVVCAAVVCAAVFAVRKKRK